MGDQHGFHFIQCLYPGRRWFQNCLNQEFYGQNLKFEVPENGLQKSIIYVFVMKKMQKKS